MTSSLLDSYRGQHLLADLLSAKLSPQLEDCCSKVVELKEDVIDITGLAPAVSDFEKMMKQCWADLQSLLTTNISGDLSDGLRSLVAQLDTGQFKASYEQLGDTPSMGAETEKHCLEIVKEACANAIKHGKARRLSLLLQADESGMKLSISDNGTTEEPVYVTGGKGMLNMQSRAETMGASITIRSNSYGGQTLELMITDFSGGQAKGRDVLSHPKETRSWVGRLGQRLSMGKTIGTMVTTLENQYSDLAIAACKVGKSQWAFELDGREGNSIDGAIAQLEELADQHFPVGKGNLELLHKGRQYGLVLLWMNECDELIASSTLELLRLNRPAITDLHHELGRSLHDCYCQGLVGALMAIQTLMETLDSDLHEVWQRMKVISLSIEKSLQKARELSHALIDYSQADTRDSPLIS